MSAVRIELHRETSLEHFALAASSIAPLLSLRPSDGMRLRAARFRFVAQFFFGEDDPKKHGFKDRAHYFEHLLTLHPEILRPLHHGDDTLEVVFHDVGPEPVRVFLGKMFGYSCVLPLTDLGVARFRWGHTDAHLLARREIVSPGRRAAGVIHHALASLPDVCLTPVRDRRAPRNQPRTLDPDVKLFVDNRQEWSPGATPHLGTGASLLTQVFAHYERFFPAVLQVGGIWRPERDVMLFAETGRWAGRCLVEPLLALVHDPADSRPLFELTVYPQPSPTHSRRVRRVIERFLEYVGESRRNGQAGAA